MDMEQLVARARENDADAEEELFRRILVRFEHFASRRVGPEEAREVAQEACVTILRKYRTEEIAGEFGAWAYGVLRMTLKNYRQVQGRRLQREQALPEGVELPERGQAPPLLRRHLRECMQWLLRKHRRYARIFNLHTQGYTTAEVCAQVGLTREQYYVYLGRSRAMLRECLASKGTRL